MPVTTWLDDDEWNAIPPRSHLRDDQTDEWLAELNALGGDRWRVRTMWARDLTLWERLTGARRVVHSLYYRPPKPAAVEVQVITAASGTNERTLRAYLIGYVAALQSERRPADR